MCLFITHLIRIKKKNGLDDEINNPVNEKIENNNGNSKDSSFYSFSSSFEIKKIFCYNIYRKNKRSF